MLCHCDNQAVVTAIRRLLPTMAHMLRCLFYLKVKHDLRLTSVHVPGVKNQWRS